MAIYSLSPAISRLTPPCLKTARHGAVFGGMGVRIYPKWVDARFLSPSAKGGRFGAHETQIGLQQLEPLLTTCSNSTKRSMAASASSLSISLDS